MFGRLRGRAVARLGTLARLLLAAGVVGAALLLAVPTVSSGGGNGHVEAIGQGWCDAWNSHNADQVLAMFTDDVIYQDVTLLGFVAHSPAELRPVAEGFFAAVPDAHFDCVSSFVRGGQGAIEWVFSGTDVGLFKTGKAFSLPGASVIAVKGQKIARNTDYWDVATLMEQVGVLPAGPAR